MKKRGKTNILFVCTGNVFRSMSAEYCLRKYLNDNEIKNVFVASVGTEAKPQKPEKDVFEKLKQLGINPTKHKQIKLNKNHFKKFDLIVAMSNEHKRFAFTHFKKNIHLFNKICYDKNSSIKDVWEAVPNPNKHPKKKRKQMRKTIKYINKSIPKFVENYKKFL
tara:strand:+ start:696 stop:1187 length:492 start_codon:yes stop_codon:yes gene_type:complete